MQETAAKPEYFHGDEPLYAFSLKENPQTIVMDFSKHPNLLVEISEFTKSAGSTPALQAGILVNHNQSCWITNLGRNGSTEIVLPTKDKRKSLANDEVVFVREGDYVGFYGSFFCLAFEESQLKWVPVEDKI